MPAEGNPDEAGQAGMQMSIHVEGGAAIVGVRRFGAHEIARKGQKEESRTPSRTPTQPSVERQRGKEHGRNAGKHEGM